VTWASNLTGALQPVAAIAELCAARGVPLHLDAVQAAPWIALRLDELPGEVTASVASHKLGGPAGIGALAGRGTATLAPVLHGGGQEHGLRPGTQSAALAAGFAAALAATVDAEATAAIRDVYERTLVARLADVELLAAAAPRLPGHSLALVDGLRGDALCALLDDAGFAVAAGSACHSADPAPEAALAAMGATPERALGALRVSFGHGSDLQDATALAAAVAEGATALRAASAAVLG
jgi:cysteine desulfurase